MAPTLSSLVLKIQIGEDEEYEYMSFLKVYYNQHLLFDIIG
jgi:hypothetical protein